MILSAQHSVTDLIEDQYYEMNEPMQLYLIQNGLHVVQP